MIFGRCLETYFIAEHKCLDIGTCTINIFSCVARLSALYETVESEYTDSFEDVSCGVCNISGHVASLTTPETWRCISVIFKHDSFRVRYFIQATVSQDTVRLALRLIRSDDDKELDRDIDEMIDGSLNISTRGDDRCLSCQVSNLALKALTMSICQIE